VNILIVASTIREVQPLIEHFRFKSLSMNLFSGKVNDTKVDCLVTGIGIIASTYVLTQYLNNKKSYQLILNAGVSRTFREELEPGSVVEVTSEQFADFGIDDNGTLKPVFEEKFIERNEFPFREGVLKNPETHPFTSSLTNVSGVTVNIYTQSENRIRFLREKFGPDIETMEGASIFYIALNQHIPFVEIRSVSCKVGPRLRINYKIALAVEKLNATLIRVCDEINIMQKDVPEMRKSRFFW
jgi:futalosine hydrolase